MVGGGRSCGCRLPTISSLSAPLHQQIVLSTMFFTNWPTGEYSLLAAFTKSQEIYAFTFYSVVSGFFSGCFYWFTCLIYLVSCTCTACRQCESWCAAGDVRAGWTCADIFHICRAWCRDGSWCAARGRSCWRMPCYMKHIYTAWVLSCGSVCGAEDPLY